MKVTHKVWITYINGYRFTKVLTPTQRPKYLKDYQLLANCFSKEDADYIQSAIKDSEQALCW
jgi:hypothetical protein